jgi:hypothetical protein
VELQEGIIVGRPFLVDWTLRAKKDTTIWSCQIVSNRTAKRPQAACSFTQVAELSLPVAACSCGCIAEKEILGWGCHLTQNKQQTNTAWVAHLSTRGEQFRGHLFVAVRAEQISFLLQQISSSL